MREDAAALLVDDCAVGICLFREDWHEGVIGVVAGRIKQERHRPAIAFARSQDGASLKGSGRSIPGLHLRDGHGRGCGPRWRTARARR